MTVGFGIRPGLLEEAVTVSVCDSFVAPELIPVRLTDCEVVVIGRTTSPTAFRVGAWFTGATVTAKVRVTMLLLGWPSLISTVIVAVPYASVTGVNLRVPVAFGLV